MTRDSRIGGIRQPKLLQSRSRAARRHLAGGNGRKETIDEDLVQIKQSVAQLITVLGQESGVIARSGPSVRMQGVLARMEQLILLLETFNQRLETASETAFRHLIDAPEVAQDERNTPRAIADDEDDAARV